MVTRWATPHIVLNGRKSKAVAAHAPRDGGRGVCCREDRAGAERTRAQESGADERPTTDHRSAGACSEEDERCGGGVWGFAGGRVA